MSISERDFNAVAAAKPKKKPREAPFSLRFSFEQMALLRDAANGVLNRPGFAGGSNS